MGRLIYQRYFAEVDHASSVAKVLARVLPQFLQLPDPGANQGPRQQDSLFRGSVDEGDLEHSVRRNPQGSGGKFVPKEGVGSRGARGE